jgi:hypothetical protein
VDGGAGAESATAPFETNTITLPPDPGPVSDPIHLNDEPPHLASGADLTLPFLDLSYPLSSGGSADHAPHLAATDVATLTPPVARDVPPDLSNVADDVPDAPAPLTGATPPAPPPYLAALTGLTVLAVPFAVAGLLGAFITLDSNLTARILAGCSVAFDLLLVLCGVSGAWRSPSHRKGLWGLGIGPLMAGLTAISGALLLDTLESNSAVIAGLATLGRVLTGVGTGTLTVYWLRANTGSVRLPAHRPSISDRVRTSRTATLLAFTGLILCGVRTDVLTSTCLLPVELFSACLVASLVRAPHSPLTLLLNRIGWIVRRSAPQDDISKPGEPTSVAANLCVVRSGRVIDLDRIPTELRLLPLPRKAGRGEQRVDAVQTE